MARKRTGSVAENQGKKGTTYTMRFYFGAERMQETLPVGRSRKEAEDELEFRVGQIARGLWTPDEPVVVTAKRDPRFAEFAESWFYDHEQEWREATRADYRWQLEKHLLPYFGDHRVSQIDIPAVDAYTAFKRREGALSGESINKTITRLGQILDVALEHDLIVRNPVRIRPRARKVKVERKRAVYLDDATPIIALLDAAGAIDREAREDRRHIPRRAIIATLVFAGLRIDEALSLRWGDVDLANRRLYVADSKTDAGTRYVPLMAPLHDELTAWRKRQGKVAAAGYVFANGEGKKHSDDNLRARMWKVTVSRANAALDKAGHPPLPAGLTFHKLRHTYISVRVALGDDSAEIGQDAGHAPGSGTTQRIYTHVMRRDDGARERLRALVTGVEKADKGGINDPAPTLTLVEDAA